MNNIRVMKKMSAMPFKELAAKHGVNIEDYMNCVTDGHWFVVFIWDTREIVACIDIRFAPFGERWGLTECTTKTVKDPGTALVDTNKLLPAECKILTADAKGCPFRIKPDRAPTGLARVGWTPTARLLLQGKNAGFIGNGTYFRIDDSVPGTNLNCQWHNELIKECPNGTFEDIDDWLVLNWPELLKKYRFKFLDM